MAAKRDDLDLARLAEPSRRFAERLFAALPDLRAGASMTPRTESPELDLEVRVASPTGDAKRDVVVWMDAGAEPSVGFGEWHTHASVVARSSDPTDRDDSIITLVEAILADRLVLTYDVGGEHDGCWGVVDLRDPDGLLDELTRKWSPGRVRIETWSGRGDREMSLDDLGSE